jgi:hypothetical protein
MGSWERHGLLVEPGGEAPWAATHAALPAVDEAPGGTVRLYYSPRDEQGRAFIARAPLAFGDVPRAGAAERDPVLAPGMLGTFDDSGVTMSCVVADGDRRLLFYTGWTRGVSVPFYFYAGLAVSDDGGASFQRPSAAPLLERTSVDPYLTASPCVLRDGGAWRMWYVSCAGWDRHAGEPRHRYLIKYAESDDGVVWRREGQVAIGFRDEREYALGRPCVVRDGDVYRMWFCARGDRYRLAYAESGDGLSWRRLDDDEGGLAPAPDGWDSDMIAYPWLLDHGGRRTILYNGNGYGRTGIGMASRELGESSS